MFMFGLFGHFILLLAILPQTVTLKVNTKSPHHAVLLVVVAENRETSSLSEFGCFFQRVVVYAFWDDDCRRVGGTNRVISVHGAQSPLLILKKSEREGDKGKCEL